MINHDELTWKNITAEILYIKFGDCDSLAIDFAESLQIPHPEQDFPKPHLIENSNSKQVKEYAQKLEEWEKHDAKFKREKKIFNECRQEIKEVIKEYIKIISGLSDLQIIDEAKEKIWELAYDKGSDGYSNIQSYLKEYIDLIKLCI